MVSFLRIAVDAIAARWHSLTGLACFRLKLTDRARNHFEQVLRLRGDDFTAYVYLGRLAYGLGDYSGWRREYEHARRTSPERFARLKHPFELFEPRAAGTLSEETGERATWRAMRSSVPHGSRGSGGQNHHAHRHGNTDDNPAHALNRHEGDRSCDQRRRFGDDFASTKERERFRGKPPIDPQDVAAVDLDAMARWLIDDL